MGRFFLYLLPQWCLLLLAAAVYAQSPGAGQFLQQLEKERRPVMPKQLPPEAPRAPLPPLMELPPIPTVTVSSFRFEGNTRLSAEQLAPVLADFLNRPLEFAELQKVVTVIAEAYRKAGWVVHAYLPNQEIEDGVVIIQIMEAVFGSTRFEGDPASRISIDRLFSMVEAVQAKGALLNATALDRALLLLDDLPGVTVTGSLTEGQQTKETDLILKVANEPLVNGEIGPDNTGARAIGPWRLTSNLYLNSLTGFGEQLSTNLVHSEGSDYGRLAVTLPVGTTSWRVGASASALAYQLITAEYAGLGASGSASTAGLEAHYPLIRSRLTNLYFALNYDRKYFDNDASGATTTRYKSDVFSVGLNGSLFDSFGGGGANAGSLTLVQGNMNLRGSPDEMSDASTTQRAGAFTKLRYAASRQQHLTDALLVFAAFSGHTANKNLDSSEKFYLGGANGVRAYPANEGAGSEGQLINLEVRGRLPQDVTLTGFYDWGHVTVNRMNAFVGAATLNHYSFQGAGITLDYVTAFGLNLKTTWAHRIGNNPNHAATGTDQDGSLMKNRLWLQASLSF